MHSKKTLERLGSVWRSFYQQQVLSNRTHFVRDFGGVANVSASLKRQAEYLILISSSLLTCNKLLTTIDGWMDGWVGWSTIITFRQLIRNEADVKLMIYCARFFRLIFQVKLCLPCSELGRRAGSER